MEDEEQGKEIQWLKSPTSKSDRNGENNKLNISPKTNSSEPSWLIVPSSTPKKTEDLGSPHGSSVSSSRRRTSLHSPMHHSEGESTCCGCCPSDPVLYWFRIFHSIAGFVGFASLAANLYVLTNPKLGLIEIVLHLYTMLFSVAIVIIEIDWRYMLSRIRIMDWWIFRGLFYGFVGFMTRELSCGCDFVILRIFSSQWPMRTLRRSLCRRLR